MIDLMAFRGYALEFMNHLLLNGWLFGLIGLIHILVLERAAVYKLLKKKAYKKLLGVIWKKARYLVGGVVLILMSFVIVNWLITLVTPEGLSDAVIEEPNLKDGGTLDKLKYFSAFTGLITISLFCFAGISLMLSAGERWLVNLSKLLCTLSVFIIIFFVFVYYIPVI